MLAAQLCLFVTPRTVAHQAPLSVEFSRQEYWSGLPFPSPGDLPNPGIEPMSLVSPTLQADSFKNLQESLLFEKHNQSNKCVTFVFFKKQ